MLILLRMKIQPFVALFVKMEDFKTSIPSPDQKDFLLDFCNSKLVDYNIKLREAFTLKDLKKVKELAFSLQQESYRIGAVELCGKLI